QVSRRRGDRIFLRNGSDARRGARLFRAAALASGPAATAQGLGRRHARELVGADVAQPEPQRWRGHAAGGGAGAVVTTGGCRPFAAFRRDWRRIGWSWKSAPLVLSPRCFGRRGKDGRRRTRARRGLLGNSSMVEQRTLTPLI